MKSFKMALIVSMLFVFSKSALAGDNGTINFYGEIVESACDLSYNTDNTKYGCSKDINNEIYNNQKNIKKEDKKYVNYDNIKKISDFPKKDGDVKKFVIDGNDIEITKISSKNYNRLYNIDIMVK